MVSALIPVPAVADDIAGTYKVPLNSPKIVGTYSSRGSRLYDDLSKQETS